MPRSMNYPNPPRCRWVVVGSCHDEYSRVWGHITGKRGEFINYNGVIINFGREITFN